MFSKLFGRKKEKPSKEGNEIIPENINWAFLGADIHSHFIPGIDDGAQVIEHSLFLIRAMQDMGYKRIVTTPHVMIDHYPNTHQIINAGLQTLQNALKENDIDMPVRAAAEYYVDEYFSQLIEKEPLLTVHQNQVLIELSMLFEHPLMNDVFFKLQSSGYRPVLAHPERYLFFHKDLDKFNELKDRGCLFQLNLLSLTGYYGRNVKSIAETLLQKNMYDYCGSDMHNDRHAIALKAMLSSKAYNEVRKHSFLNSKISF